jgi:hypothetical protein
MTIIKTNELAIQPQLAIFQKFGSPLYRVKPLRFDTEQGKNFCLVQNLSFLIVTDFGVNTNFKELREVSVKKNKSLIN